MESSCSWSTSSVVRGHHDYKNIWTPSIGERLQLCRQDHEQLRPSCRERREGIVGHVPREMSCRQDHEQLRPSCRERREGIVGHVPREMSRTFWDFIMHGGSVGCEIMGRSTLGKGGADKRGGAHSLYQFFRCGKIGGRGADKRWGAL